MAIDPIAIGNAVVTALFGQRVTTTSDVRVDRADVYDAVRQAVTAETLKQPAPQVRVLRLLEYVGTREAVEHQLKSGMFPGGGGCRTFQVRDRELGLRGDLTLNSVLVTQWPETLDDARVQAIQHAHQERDLSDVKLGAAIAALRPLHESDLAREIGLEWGEALSSDGVAKLIAEVQRLRGENEALRAAKVQKS